MLNIVDGRVSIGALLRCRNRDFELPMKSSCHHRNSRQRQSSAGGDGGMPAVLMSDAHITCCHGHKDLK